ncbi:MAG: polysaccharide deacetylase family protein [Pseudomonadota bacterium]
MTRLLRRFLSLLPDAQERVHYFVETTEPVVALTIDDAPDPQTTDEIASVLAEHGALSTFFITGQFVDEAPMVLERLAAAGHQFGNHLMLDRPVICLSRERFAQDFESCANLLQPYGGARVFRPPSGVYRRYMIDFVASQGCLTVLGDAFPLDTHISSQKLRMRLLRSMIEPGSIIVLHDRAERGRRTAETLSLLLSWLEETGLRPVLLSELLPMPLER